MPPNNSEALPASRTATGVKRRSIACDACAKRKIKCDRATPRCDWCSNQNLKCTYNRNHRSSKKIKIDHQRSQASSALDTNQRYSLPETAYIVPNSGSLQLAGQNLGNILAFNGMPFFSPGGREWVQVRTGMDVDPSRLFTPHSLAPSHHCFAPADKGPIPLPYRATLSHYFMIYSSSIFSQLFPLLDVELFHMTIQVAYDRPSSSTWVITASARMCIYAFMAFTSSLFVHMTEAENGERYALEAQKLLADLLQHQATIEGLQTVLFLALHYQFTLGDLSSIDILLSTASRFVYSLGGHLSPGVSRDSIPRPVWHCRKLFWICYTIDRKVCLRTGRPPCINDSYCDLSLPDHFITSIKSELLPSRPDIEPIFLSDLRLSMIESKIFLELYAAPALSKSDAELLRTIRDLDTAVEQWKALALNGHQIPPLEPNATLDASHKRATLFHMQYLYAVATIHQATTRCSAWIQDQGRIMEGVSSSLVISVGASRQLLQLLYATPLVSQEGSFWYGCHFFPERLFICTLTHKYVSRFSLFFVLSAAIILFCNILRSPHAPETPDDILILEALATHIRASSQCRASPRVQPNIDIAERFTAELGYLARCAVRKAQVDLQELNN
ncbi:hypothetical protein BBP40_001166 [Aspergillus hancockii]|nr:hypothetical protein BBP40_001166 [Aspergillus hancockii]